MDCMLLEIELLAPVSENVKEQPFSYPNVRDHAFRKARALTIDTVKDPHFWDEFEILFDSTQECSTLAHTPPTSCIMWRMRIWLSYPIIVMQRKEYGTLFQIHSKRVLKTRLQLNYSVQKIWVNMKPLLGKPSRWPTPLSVATDLKNAEHPWGLALSLGQRAFLSLWWLVPITADFTPDTSWQKLWIFSHHSLISGSRSVCKRKEATRSIYWCVLQIDFIIWNGVCQLVPIWSLRAFQTYKNFYCR